MRSAAIALLFLTMTAPGCGGSGKAGGGSERRQADEPEEHQIVRDTKEGAEWVAGAMRDSGYNADFSPESLWEVDRFFAEQMKGPGKAKRRGLLSEQRGPRLFALGAYLGEVIRRNSSGWRWVPDEEDPDDELGLSLVREGGATLWPIQRSTKRFIEGDENGIADYAAVAAGLDLGPRPR